MKMYPSLAALLLACVLAFAPLTQAAQHLPININTATAEQIAEALDGVGEVRAAAIILLREQLGGLYQYRAVTRYKWYWRGHLKTYSPCNRARVG
jgi:competence ComEA-like helix-hairpin-helix protein